MQHFFLGGGRFGLSLIVAFMTAGSAIAMATVMLREADIFSPLGFGSLISFNDVVLSPKYTILTHGHVLRQHGCQSCLFFF